MQILILFSGLILALNILIGSAALASQPTHGKKPAAQSKLARKISAAQAVALVKKRKDVQDFLALFPHNKSPRTGGYPIVEAEEMDTYWNVHVYEQTPDHTATMNWFEVDYKTGAVKPMDE